MSRQLSDANSTQGGAALLHEIPGQEWFYASGHWIGELQRPVGQGFPGKNAKPPSASK
jgi:hypothetical protein